MMVSLFLNRLNRSQYSRVFIKTLGSSVASSDFSFSWRLFSINMCTSEMRSASAFSNSTQLYRLIGLNRLCFTVVSIPFGNFNIAASSSWAFCSSATFWAIFCLYTCFFHSNLNYYSNKIKKLTMLICIRYFIYWTTILSKFSFIHLNLSYWVIFRLI